MKRNIETKIRLSASPEKIWEQLIQFEQYKHWNPFIVQASGTAQVGNKIAISIALNNKIQSFDPVITEAVAHRKLAWKGHLYRKGIFDGEHYFILNPTSTHETELIHGERFSGVLSPIVLPIISEATMNGFTRMNLSLKKHLESDQ